MTLVIKTPDFVCTDFCVSQGEFRHDSEKFVVLPNNDVLFLVGSLTASLEMAAHLYNVDFKPEASGGANLLVARANGVLTYYSNRSANTLASNKSASVKLKGVLLSEINPNMYFGSGSVQCDIFDALAKQKLLDESLHVRDLDGLKATYSAVSKINNGVSNKFIAFPRVRDDLKGVRIVKNGKVLKTVIKPIPLIRYIEQKYGMKAGTLNKRDLK